MKKLLPILLQNILFISAFAQSDTTLWNKTADTGRSVSYMTDFEKDVLQELNKARSNPSLYATLYIEPMLTEFKGTVNIHDNIQTQEGVRAVKECIVQLKSTAKIVLLAPNELLYGTAHDHTSTQSKTREVGHTSPNGKTFVDRIKPLRFPRAGECISYGQRNGRDVVTSLLIDDGVENRGHRKTILNPQLDAAGISAGGHLAFGHMCTIDFAGGVRSH
jgi:uncharacterized protein YkwD